MGRMAARLAAAVMAVAGPVVLVAAPVILVAAPASAASWSWLNDAGEKFAVELPGTASARRFEQPVGNGTMLPTVEYSLTAEGATYMVNSANFRLDPTPEQLAGGFAAALDAVLTKEGGTQTWRRAATVSGKPGLEIEYSHVVGGAPMRTRVLLTFGGQRFYTVSVRRPAETPVAATDRMMRSFRLL